LTQTPKADFLFVKSPTPVTGLPARKPRLLKRGLKKLYALGEEGFYQAF
jgi:hypothetical protein